MHSRAEPRDLSRATTGPAQLPGRRVRRRLRIAALVLLVVSAWAAVAAPPAFAHGGKRLTIRQAGPYLVEIYALLVRSGQSVLIDYTSYLRDRATEFPVNDARVHVAVRQPDGRTYGPFLARPFANSYEVLLPVSNPDAWRRLRLLVTITSPRGTATIDYSPPSLASAWLPQTSVFIGAALAIALFLQAFVRLRRRGRRDHAAFWRLGVFGLGVALIVLALVSPLDPVGESFLLSAHMLEHVVIGDAGPALLVLAVSGPLLFFLLPRPLLRLVARQRWIRRGLAFSLRPRNAVIAWALVYASWHIPLAYDYVLTRPLVHDLEHVSFMLVGLLVWAQLIDPARTHRLTLGKRLGIAFIVFAFGSVLSDVLLFSRSPLYPAYAAQAERLWSLTPLRDQQLAGVVMMGEQAISLGACALILILRNLRVGPQGEFLLTKTTETDLSVGER